ncbi:DinB family protein [Candidatus Leptofilum sp.]|uniref:DinB family protein n=1 Tax=Candidatus Leptofilum sp. TaxID=3241576 RepID=UPI003B5B5620
MSSDGILTIDQLLAQVEEATAATTAVIEKCSEVDWKTAVPEEERTVGVVLHHIAFTIPFVVEWACNLAKGEGAPAVGYDDIHGLNHQHAVDQANVDKATTLALLQTHAQAAQEQLGQLTDADLQIAALFPLIGGQEITAQQMVQWFLINHAHNHLEAIHNTIGGKQHDHDYQIR